MSKKTLKALKKNRKKYNEGGIPTPVAPTPVAPTGVPEDTSLLQPQIQETPESAAGAAQKTMPMQSTGHGGLGSTYRPEGYEGEGYIPPPPTYGIPPSASQEEIDAYNENQAAQEARFADKRYITGPLAAGSTVQHVEDQIAYAMRQEDSAQRVAAIEESLENFPELHNEYYGLNPGARGYIDPTPASEPTVTAAPEWTGASVDDITQAARMAEVGIPPSEGDLAKFDYNGDGDITYQDAFDYANGDAPGLLAGTAPPVVEEPVAPEAPEVYDGSTTMPEGATVSDFEKRIEFLSEGPGGSSASSAFANSIKNSNPELYYATFPEEREVEEVEEIKSFDPNNPPDIHSMADPEIVRDYYDYLVSTRSRGSSSVRNEIINHPFLFNAVFPEEQPLPVPTQPIRQSEPETEETVFKDESETSVEPYDRTQPLTGEESSDEIRQREEYLGRLSRSDQFYNELYAVNSLALENMYPDEFDRIYSERQALEQPEEQVIEGSTAPDLATASVEEIEARRQYLEEFGAQRDLSMFEVSLRAYPEKYNEVYFDRQPLPVPEQEVEEEEPEEILGQLTFERGDAKPSLDAHGDYLTNLDTVMPLFEADMQSWEIAQGLRTSYTPQQYEMGDDMPDVNTYRNDPNGIEKFKADMAEWNAANQKGPKQFYWERGDDQPVPGAYENAQDFLTAKYYYQKAGNTFVEAPVVRGPYADVANPNNIDMQAQIDSINQTGLGAIMPTSTPFTEADFNPEAKGKFSFTLSDSPPIPLQYPNAQEYQKAVNTFNSVQALNVPTETRKTLATQVQGMLSMTGFGDSNFYWTYAKTNLFGRMPDMLTANLPMEFKWGDDEPTLETYYIGTPEKFEQAWTNWKAAQDAGETEEAKAERLAKEEERKRLAEEQKERERLEAEEAARIAAEAYVYEPDVADMGVQLDDNGLIDLSQETTNSEEWRSVYFNRKNYNAELEGVLNNDYEVGDPPPNASDFVNENYFVANAIRWNAVQKAALDFGPDVVIANSMDEVIKNEYGNIVADETLGTAENPLPPLSSLSPTPEWAHGAIKFDGTKNPLTRLYYYTDYASFAENQAVYNEGEVERFEAEESARIAEEARLAEETRKAEEEAERKRVEEEEAKRQEEIRLADEQRKKEEAEAEAQRLADIAAEEKRKQEEAEAAAAEEKRKADEAAAEAQRLADLAAEEKRKEEEAAAEAQRLADIAAEEQRLADIAAEEQRIADEKEAQRLADEAAAAAATKKAEEEEAAAEAQRLADIAAEEQRLAEIAAEEQRKADEAAAEAKRLADIAAEEQRKAEEAEAKRLADIAAAEEKERQRQAEQAALEAEAKKAEEEAEAERLEQERLAAEEALLADAEAERQADLIVGLPKVGEAYPNGLTVLDAGGDGSLPVSFVEGHDINTIDWAEYANRGYDGEVILSNWTRAGNSLAISTTGGMNLGGSSTYVSKYFPQYSAPVPEVTRDSTPDYSYIDAITPAPLEAGATGNDKYIDFAQNEMLPYLEAAYAQRDEYVNGSNFTEPPTPPVNPGPAIMDPAFVEPEDYIRQDFYYHRFMSQSRGAAIKIYNHANALYTIARAAYDADQQVTPEPPSTEFVMPTFTAADAGNPPLLMDYPEDKRLEVYAAWKLATGFEEPIAESEETETETEPVTTDASGRPLVEFYNYEGSEGQMPTAENYEPTADTPMPTAGLFLNSPLSYLQNFDAYMTKWQDRPQPEPEQEVEAPEAQPWQVAEYTKGSDMPNPNDFRNPNYPANSFTLSINAWVSAQDIQLGDPKPVKKAGMIDQQYAPLLGAWYAAGNTDDPEPVMSPPTPDPTQPSDSILDQQQPEQEEETEQSSDSILDQQEEEEATGEDTGLEEADLPEQSAEETSAEEAETDEDELTEEDIPEEEILVNVTSTPERDYSFLLKPERNDYFKFDVGGKQYLQRKAEATRLYNQDVALYNAQVENLDKVYDKYLPIIEGTDTRIPTPPKRVYEPTPLQDGASESSLRTYQTELARFKTYEVASELYSLALPIAQNTTEADNMARETTTRLPGASVNTYNSSNAPVGIELTTPTTPTITQSADSIDTTVASGTITEGDSVQTLDQAGTASAPTITQGNLGTTAQQGAPTSVAGPDTDVTGSSYTASTVGEDVVTGTAATDVTGVTQATATAPTATGATAATVDQADITAAQATAATGTLSENSLAIAATSWGKAKTTPEYVALEAASETAKAEMEDDPLYKASQMVIPIAIENGASEGHIQGLYSSLYRVPSYQKYRLAEKERLDYLEGAGTQRIAEVEGPQIADTYSASTLSTEDLDELLKIAGERGVNLEDLPAYDTAKQRTAQSAAAAQGTAAQLAGEEAPTATAATAETGTATGVSALTTDIEDVPAYAKAATRTAQTADAATGEATVISDADVATDLEGREAITGTAPQGSAAEIGGVPTYEAAQMQATTSEDRTLNASEMLEVVADMPEATAAAIAQDPATVEAQLDTDPDPEVSAKIAALPKEALVSSQMEVLLAGIEDGNIPTWARPTVDALEGIMARRGLSASTVGRDALFNAIIQSALPIAQGNATALQNRANLNLQNEQNAEIAAANNVMQVRIQNLANRQLAASETARMAQEIAVKQSTFDQQAAVISSEQQQQTALINTQNAQSKAAADAQMQQQAALAEFSENSRRDYENLKALNDASANNLNAEQSLRLKKYDAELATIIRQAELDQDIEKANLNASLSVELQNLTQQNDAAKDTMTAENQERLVNLQTLVDLRKTNATLAQQMDMANLTNEQQIELAVLQDKAATDSANFTADNQFRLTELNNKVARNIRQAELDQRIAEINLDAALKLELTELTELNATNRANMTAENQVRLANLNALIDFKKTNATFTQQMELANLSNEQQITIANLTEKAAADAANFTEANRFELQKLTTAAQLLSTNEQLRLNADMARLSTEERVALANLTYTNQFDSAKMTAENTAELQRYEKQIAVAQGNAQLAQQMGLAELSNSQQAAMFNAQVNANLDMKQFDFDQQIALANSTFMQSMTIKEFDAEQQVAIQNATMFANMSMAGADQATKLAITNAQNFLQMDLSNLANKQQISVLNAQMAQQAMLSDVAAENAAAQFNAANQQQADQYMASLGVQIEQYNVSAMSARNQFNAAERNRQAAINAGNFQQAQTIMAQMEADLLKFNEQQDLARDQWNAANAQAVEQSNIQWRRQANTANTAAQNAANQQNAQIAFNLTSQEQTQLWQQLRDEAAYLRQAYENQEQRNAQLYATAISNEKLATSTSKLQDILNISV